MSAFITVDVAFSREIGSSVRRFTGSEEWIYTALLSTVSLSAYGKNAYFVANKLRTLLQSSAALSFFKAQKAGIVSFSDVRNLTATVGADYEERGQFDMVISHSHVVAVPLDAIAQVDIHTQTFSHSSIQPITEE
ncbi:hypothetical protein A4G19_12445 [Pasteurellaceae bacterium Macca]|nr:hypothetical protein [Pasteurellaceae bacterium Macca]MCK3656244.1 hypothetical protein [Pasteurellaceae bacterium Macca]MCK3656520.1 hypothetical protein [Pasteurellaceae bacterium Macca]